MVEIAPPLLARNFTHISTPVDRGLCFHLWAPPASLPAAYHPLNAAGSGACRHARMRGSGGSKSGRKLCERHRLVLAALGLCS